MKVFIIVNPVSERNKFLKEIGEDSYVIAVDGALSFCAVHNLKVDIAIGDFDSLNDQNLLDKYEHIRLDRKKDVTDTYYAVVHAYEISDDVIVIGGLGGARLEHGIANINLLYTYPNLIISSEKTEIKRLDKGIHDISYNGYISIFPFPSAKVTLKGFKYPLNEYEFLPFDSIGISNELKTTGNIHVHEGSVLLCLTEKDHED